MMHKGERYIIDKYQIRTILNCGGSCALKACELDPEMAERVNVLGIRSLLKAIEGTEIQLLHLSIDLVFSGTGDGNHLETDPTDPVTVYGKTMVAAEKLIASQRPQSCVMRISLPMGISFNGHAGAIDCLVKHHDTSVVVVETISCPLIASPEQTGAVSVPATLATRGLRLTSRSPRVSAEQCAHLVMYQQVL